MEKRQKNFHFPPRFFDIVFQNNKVNSRQPWWGCFQAKNKKKKVLFIMHLGQLTPLGQLSFPINPSKVVPPWHKAALMMCLWSPPAKHYAQTLNQWWAEEKWCYASFKSEAKQSRLIDDQHSLTLMRPCCPRPGPVQYIRDFFLTAPLSLISLAFSTAGTVIVGFNYFTTKWYRWKIGVCN